MLVPVVYSSSKSSNDSRPTNLVARPGSESLAQVGRESLVCDMSILVFRPVTAA